MTLSSLFGLGWGIGLLATQDIYSNKTVHNMVAALFILLTTFHGVFIFIMHSLRSEKVRKVWKKWFFGVIVVSDKSDITFSSGNKDATLKSKSTSGTKEATLESKSTSGTKEATPESKSTSGTKEATLESKSTSGTKEATPESKSTSGTKEATLESKSTSGTKEATLESKSTSGTKEATLESKSTSGTKETTLKSVPAVDSSIEEAAVSYNIETSFTVMEKTHTKA